MKRAVGTRTFWDMIKTLGRKPSEADLARDADAVQSGEGRAVSCFLRGSFEEYPRTFTHGTLDLLAHEATWRPFSRRHGAPIELRSVNRIVSVDPATDLRLKGSQFRVIVAETSEGTLELAVPKYDVNLVRRFLPQSRL